MTQWLELRLCDFGIVSSERVRDEAMRATGMPKEAFPIANLLYPRRRKDVDEGQKREWVVFLGRATEERGIRDFLDYACFLQRRGVGRKLAILTRDNLDWILADYDERTLASLEIRHGSVIPEEDIDRFLRQAICCVLPSRVDVMQSGIPGTVYARGCALVATAVEGVQEYIVPGRTGVILGEKPARPEDIEAAVCAMQARVTCMSSDCHRHFDEHFGSGAFRRYYGWLIDDAEQTTAYK
jgi:glycosyltransferase involved in cell wall biosynthesis